MGRTVFRVELQAEPDARALRAQARIVRLDQHGAAFEDLAAARESVFGQPAQLLGRSELA